MNAKTASTIRESCAAVQAMGIRVSPGAWFEWEGGKIVACCPVGAVLIAKEKLPPGADGMSCEPGYVRAACEALGEDFTWLRRFWLGFDRGYQVMIIHDERTETKDDVSSFGIQLSRELS